MLFGPVKKSRKSGLTDIHTHGVVFIYISEFNHNVSDFSKEQNKDRKSDLSI